MTPAQPQWIFIICAARSGSKYLRGLLAASPEVAAVPYDVNFLWRRGQDSSPDDALKNVPDGRIGDGIQRRLIELSRWSAGGRARFIVEKSVSNSLRVPFLMSMFPEAKFVHLVRDGRAVIESARRMWASRPEPEYLVRKIASLQLADWRYCMWFTLNQLRRFRPAATSRPVWGPRYPGIEEDLRQMDLTAICARQWVECVSRSCSALDGLKTARAFRLRYEDLAGSGDALEGLCRFIGITDPAPVMAAHEREMRPDYIDAWTSKLSSVDQDRIEATTGDWLRHLGYAVARTSGLPS